MRPNLPKSNASWGRKKVDTQSDEVFITHHSVVHPTVGNPASNLRSVVPRDLRLVTWGGLLGLGGPRGRH